jgi:hypothetical protein
MYLLKTKINSVYLYLYILILILINNCILRGNFIEMERISFQNYYEMSVRKNGENEAEIKRMSGKEQTDRS